MFCNFRFQFLLSMRCNNCNVSFRMPLQQKWGVECCHALCSKRPLFRFRELFQIFFLLVFFFFWVHFMTLTQFELFANCYLYFTHTFSLFLSLQPRNKMALPYAQTVWAPAPAPHPWKERANWAHWVASLSPGNGAEKRRAKNSKRPPNVSAPLCYK